MAFEQINTIRVERAALDLLSKYGIECPGFDIEDLAEAEGLEVRRGDLPHADAWLVRHPGGGGVIRVKSDMKESGRFRFSVGHELGHWILHPTLSQTIICTASDLTDYAKSIPEAEANLFSANLLMPAPWVRVELQKADPTFDVVEKIAADFDTSLTAAAWRFVELSKQPVVLVFSRDGCIRWAKRSGLGQSMFLKTGDSLPEHCATVESLANGKNPKTAEDVGLKTWFPDWRCEEDAELFEDVRIAPEYGWALTLLWNPR
jgi:hypothetical protein